MLQMRTNKKNLLSSVSISFLLIIMFTGCAKKDDTQSCNFDPCGYVVPATEIQQVQSYLASQNNTTAIKHCSGMFYEIITPGTGKTPTVCNSVNVTYTGTQTNGATFDSRTTTFGLSGVIAGWQIGIPLIKEGGHIRLYIPPSLGYGNQQAGTIPPNSVLIFDVTLNAVY